METSGRWSERTSEDRYQYLRDHILPNIGHLDVDDLRREDVLAWIDYADSAMITTGQDDKPLDDPKPYAHKTVRSWWSLVKRLCKALYLEEYIDLRMLEWVRDQPGPSGYKGGRRESRTLTLEELRKYVDTAKKITPTRYAEIITLAYTGMRYGELYGLDWDHIDYEEGTITVTQSFSEGRLGPTKTGVERVAPMVPAVAEAIQEHRQRLVKMENLGLFEGIVFPSDVGKRRHNTLHKPMGKVTDALGLDVKVGPQVLRKTFTTLLRAHGAHSEQIMAIVGHESKEMHDHYTVPTADELRRTVGVLVP